MVPNSKSTLLSFRLSSMWAGDHATEEIGLTNRFPHILPQDAKVWTKFLHGNPDFCDYYDYDIRVGKGIDPGNIVEEKFRRMSIHLSQRRIDIVGYRNDCIFIIELTQKAGIKALGQLSAYPNLYKDTFKPTLKLKPLLICSGFKADAERAFQMAKIPYIIIDI